MYATDPVRFSWHFLLSWWGLILLAALDTSVIFTLPIALDAVVVIMSAMHRSVFWLVPLLATGGALVGAATSIKVGEILGEKGLSRIVPAKVLNRIHERVQAGRVTALIAAPLMPPPFPFTAVIVSAGALGVPRSRVLSAIGLGLGIRFSLESVLALIYGRRIISWFESDVVRDTAIGMIALAALAAVVSLVMLLKKRPKPTSQV